MAEAVGAAVTGMPDIQIHPCGHPKTGLMVDIRTSGRNRIFVNQSGARFVNEGAARDALCKAIFAQPDSTYWIVVNHLRYPSRDFVDRNGATIANMVAQGNVIEADSLEKLAELTGMDAKALQASIDQYNSVVRKEMEKDEFGFEANNKDDKEMTEGPWYACRKVPSVHHTMGGLKINVDTQVLDKDDQVIPGLFAAGEVTGGIHGANRLGGNSLLETIVFGKVAARAITEDLPHLPPPDQKPLLRLKEEVEEKMRRLTEPGRERPYRLQADLGAVMNEKVGIFRTRGELEQALESVIGFKERYRGVGVSSPVRHMNYELTVALELEHMLEVSHTIILGALLREESRGAHYRTDFSTRNDRDWLKHTIATRGADGAPVISFKDVVITRYQPVERKY